jgi:rubrerythrin
MKEFKTITDILDFAISAEQEAVDFYSRLATQARGEQMKKVFLEFAEEEMKHKVRLTGIKESGTYEMAPEKVKDLKISDYIVDVVPSPSMTYEEALILAMKKEKNAFRLYMMLSGETTDPSMKALFLSLAQEESKHKLRFEVEYDEYILREN